MGFLARGVFVRGVLSGGGFCPRTFKLYQHLALHVVTPVWPENPDAAYPVSIVL